MKLLKSLQKIEINSINNLIYLFIIFYNNKNSTKKKRK